MGLFTLKVVNKNLFFSNMSHVTHSIHFINENQFQELKVGKSIPHLFLHDNSVGPFSKKLDRLVSWTNLIWNDWIWI